MTEPFILSLSNRKGGSGKTTTVVNLAAEWASWGHRVLVVDLDTQGHSAYGLGLDPVAADRTVHQVFRDPAFDVRTAIQATAWDNLFCIPADNLFDGSDLSPETGRLARQLRRPEMAEFDLILLDTPPSLDALLTNALAAADGVLVPLVPHALAVEGVKQLSRLFYKTVTSVNARLKLVGLLPVMASDRVGHHRAVMADIVRQYGSDKVMRPIRSDIQLAAAFALRKPIRAFAPRSRGALDYHLLAHELASVWPRLGIADAGPVYRKLQQKGS